MTPAQLTRTTVQRLTKLHTWLAGKVQRLHNPASIRVTKRLLWQVESELNRREGRATEPEPMSHKPWTPEEEAIIRKYYPTTNSNEMVDLLPGRKACTIIKRAGKLGVEKDGRVRISLKQQEYIAAHYPAEGSGKVAAALGIDRNAVARWVKRRGLTRNPEQLRQENLAKLPKRGTPAPKLKLHVSPSKPDYRADKRPPCGKERKAGAAKAKPVEPAKKWYTYPRGSAEYKAGEAAYFASKQARSITDQYGRPATVYSNIIR